MSKWREVRHRVLHRVRRAWRKLKESVMEAIMMNADHVAA
jgi:hypothetical protein